MVDLPLRAGPPTGLPAPQRVVLDAGPRFRLSVLDVGLACCAVELVAAAGRTSEPDPDAQVVDLEVMVVAGTVTDALAPAVRALYDALPEPRRVISFGACANCGGPYWDSYCVTKGVDQILPVDLYVPGCPPRPEALLHAVLQLAESSDRPRPHSTAAPVRPGSGRSPLGPQDLRRPLSPPGPA